MNIAVGADHKGFDFKEKIKTILAELGHTVTDFGTNSADESVDYPDFGLKSRMRWPNTKPTMA